MTDFLLIKDILVNGYKCFSLIEQKEIVLFFRSEQDNDYLYQNKVSYSKVFLCNDKVNHKLVGFAADCSSLFIVNNSEYCELVCEFYTGAKNV